MSTTLYFTDLRSARIFNLTFILIFFSVRASRQSSRIFNIDNKETVFVMLKKHVGWTKGMIRLHRITFVDEREANCFLSTYNLLAATIGSL